VPLYERIRTEAIAGGITVACWLYVRTSASRERAPAGMLARHGRSTVLAQIRAFRLSRE
jgi:hypothetical protein